MFRISVVAQSFNSVLLHDGFADDDHHWKWRVQIPSTFQKWDCRGYKLQNRGYTSGYSRVVL